MDSDLRQSQHEKADRGHECLIPSEEFEKQDLEKCP